MGKKEKEEKQNYREGRNLLSVNYVLDILTTLPKIVIQNAFSPQFYKRVARS